MKKISTMLLTGVLAVGLLGAGCGDDTNDANNSGGSDSGTGRSSIETFDSGDEPLDQVQALLYEALVAQIGSSVEDTPAENFVLRLTTTLNYLLQGPDEVLAALTSGDSTQYGTAGAALASNLTIAVDELLCAIGSLASEDCPTSLSTGSVPGEFANLESLLILLQGELGDGNGADLHAVTTILEDVVTELENLALSDTELPGDPYASSLFDLLAQTFGDTSDLLHAIGIEDAELANQALVDTVGNLLENLLIGLPQIDDTDPALADQIENEITIVTAALDSYTQDLLAALINYLLDPLSDLLGFGEGFEGLGLLP